MKRTIHLSDHRYTEKHFTVLESLPELHERHENKWAGEWYEYVDLTEITDKVARHDEGDGGYYRYYIAVKDWGYLNDPDDTEIKTDDLYIAVWENYPSLRYAIRDREAGNIIAEFDTLAEAEDELAEYESIDKTEGNYTPDFYEIVDREKNY